MENKNMYEDCKVEFVEAVPGTFRCNAYGTKRHIGLVDVRVNIDDWTEYVTLAYYRSSGTNDGKRQGQWYPILGIKPTHGEFTEFGELINWMHNQIKDQVKVGWFMKALFFTRPNAQRDLPEELVPYAEYDGYSYTTHGKFLKELGASLEQKFESNNFKKCADLDMAKLNKTLYDESRESWSDYTQKELISIIAEDMLVQLAEN